ncbi:GntR family transcriptional regulator [Streptococcus fryi]
MAWIFDEKSPIYAQIAHHIKLQIISGVIKSGQQLATVRELAEEAGVNPNTIQRAFTELEREGIVYSQRTSGRFVTDDLELIRQQRQELAETEILNFISKMKQIGLDNQSIINTVSTYLETSQVVKGESL